MNDQNYTLLKLSKLFAENGCELESENAYIKNEESEAVNVEHWEIVDGEWGSCQQVIFNEKDKTYNSIMGVRAYDILNDICVKYAKEIFGEKLVCENCGSKKGFYNDCGSNICKYCGCSGNEEEQYIYYTKRIFRLRQQNKTQEAEDYIWEHCKFNKKNGNT